MTRKALIIGAAYGDPRIPGVYTDLTVWSAFLCSDLGGAWRDEEIIILRDPDLDQARRAVRSLEGNDFGFVIFCGHGEVVQGAKPWPETVLSFGRHGDLTETEMNPGTPRCTLLLDCCRRPADAEDDRTYLTEEKSASFSARQSTRELFDKAMAAAEKGLVKIYAASVGEYADDDKSFSKQLIHQAKITMQTSTGVLDQSLAVELTAEAMKTTLPQQHPEYRGGRRLRHYPFAVDA